VKAVVAVLPTLRLALMDYYLAKKIKASSQKRYESLMRTHFGEWFEESVSELGGLAFAAHCRAFANSKGSVTASPRPECFQSTTT